MKDENEQGLDTGEDWSGDWAGRPIDAVKRSKKREMYVYNIDHSWKIHSVYSIVDDRTCISTAWHCKTCMPFRVEIELEQFYAGDPGTE